MPKAKRAISEPKRVLLKSKMTFLESKKGLSPEQKPFRSPSVPSGPFHSGGPKRPPGIWVRPKDMFSSFQAFGGGNDPVATPPSPLRPPLGPPLGYASAFSVSGLVYSIL